MDEKDKIIIFLAKLLQKEIYDTPLTDNEYRALNDILLSFPDVEAEEFIYYD